MDQIPGGNLDVCLAYSVACGAQVMVDGEVISLSFADISRTNSPAPG